MAISTGLITDGYYYVNPNYIRTFSKDVSDSRRTDVQIMAPGADSRETYYNFKVPVDKFANAMIKAQNTGDIVDVRA